MTREVPETILKVKFWQEPITSPDQQRTNVWQIRDNSVRRYAWNQVKNQERAKLESREQKTNVAMMTRKRKRTKIQNFVWWEVKLYEVSTFLWLPLQYIVGMFQTEATFRNHLTIFWKVTKWRNDVHTKYSCSFLKDINRNDQSSSLSRLRPNIF